LKWFFGILDHLIIRLKKYDRSLNLPPDSPTRWQVARELLNPGDKNTSFDVYDSEDLKPFVAEVRSYIRNLLRMKL